MCKDEVFFVGSQFLCVTRVRSIGLDFRDEALVEKYLADMRRPKTRHSIVGEDFRVRVGENCEERSLVEPILKTAIRYNSLTVNVCGTASIVTGENRIKSHDAFFISLLKATKSSVVEIRLIRGIAIALGDNPSVNTLK